MTAAQAAASRMKAAFVVTQSIFTNTLASGGSFTDPVTEGSAGGAIDSQGPSLTVTASAFTNNQAVGPATGTGEGNGGAINNSSPATITNSSFNGNLALGRSTNGGAISAGENELTTPPLMAISNCTFLSNLAKAADGANDFTEKFGGQALGGAIASAAPLTITASAFTDNLAKAGDHGNNLNPIDGGPFADSAYGGGVINIASSLSVSNTTFFGNRAIGGSSVAGVSGTAVGGGVASEIFASTTLTNVTLVGNQAIGGSGGPGYTGGTAFGGGFYNGVDSTGAVSDSLFSGNLAAGGSGGSGAAGGVGAGGAIANGGGFGALEVTFLGLPADTSTLSVAGSTLIFNVAQRRGATAGPGATAAAAWGGGCFVFRRNHRLDRCHAHHCQRGAGRLPRLGRRQWPGHRRWPLHRLGRCRGAKHVDRRLFQLCVDEQQGHFRHLHHKLSMALHDRSRPAVADGTKAVSGASSPASVVSMVWRPCHNLPRNSPLLWKRVDDAH